MAVRKIRDKAKVLAAHLLEASAEDMEYDDGKFFVKGSPDKSKTIQDVALMANVAWDLPEGMEAGLEASTFYDPPNFVFPYGSHLAIVEVEKTRHHVAAPGVAVLVRAHHHLVRSVEHVRLVLRMLHVVHRVLVPQSPTRQRDIVERLEVEEVGAVRVA